MKKARLEGKQLLIRQSINWDIYELLIQAVKRKNYRVARLRVTFYLLTITITSIRINELLPLKIQINLISLNCS